MPSQHKCTKGAIDMKTHKSLRQLVHKLVHTLPVKSNEGTTWLHWLAFS